MANYSPFALKLQSTWSRCQRLPAGSWIFSRLMGWMVPYSGSIGARIVELRPGYARVQLNDRRKVRNHLRSVHAIAMVNLGEMATGLALNSGLPAGARSILLSIKVDFTRKARGLLTASCECALPQDNSKQDMSLKAEIRDADSEVVASCTAVWRVGA